MRSLWVGWAYFFGVWAAGAALCVGYQTGCNPCAALFILCCGNRVRFGRNNSMRISSPIFSNVRCFENVGIETPSGAACGGSTVCSACSCLLFLFDCVAFAALPRVPLTRRCWLVRHWLGFLCLFTAHLLLYSALLYSALLASVCMSDLARRRSELAHVRLPARGRLPLLPTGEP